LEDLETGGWLYTDKVIIGDVRRNQWIEYEFTRERIEGDSLWESSKFPSLLDYCCAETSIDSINSGQIVLNYRLRANDQADLYEQRKIYYGIDELTGKIRMIKVE
jgi:hypothetical protein